MGSCWRKVKDPCDQSFNCKRAPIQAERLQLHAKEVLIEMLLQELVAKVDEQLPGTCGWYAQAVRRLLVEV